MKKIITLILLTLSSLKIYAAEVGIIPLFSTHNWIVGLNIPLRITGISLTNSTEVLTEILPASLSALECKIMRDPFIAENFLLRCLKEGSVSLKFTINPPNAANPSPQTRVLLYGPLIINKLDGLKIPDEESGSNNSVDVIIGQQLFGAHCINCHTGKSQFLTGHPNSSESIWSAINGGQSEMLGLQSVLTQAQVEQISVYLKAP